MKPQAPRKCLEVSESSRKIDANRPTTRYIELSLGVGTKADVRFGLREA